MNPTSSTPVDPLRKSVRALSNRPENIRIKELRFPNYRNLEANARLPFEFPVTVLLGRNGTNKSSILHALYGSPSGKSIGDFWFETRLDAIPETRDGLKQSVTHTYTNESGQDVECIKSRAPRKERDPDYWEAVKPTGLYGFAPGAKRAPPITLKVLHLDFRAELPAFDKYFYFPDPVHLDNRAGYARERDSLRREYRKQDYLRRRSGRLRNAMQKNGQPLSTQVLSTVSYILEREYQAGTILTHSLLHGHKGRTIRFDATNLEGQYSDAFAGSGESAATFLVHDVLSAEKGSLVLLDEPETSLHPRAQQRMLEFLCHVAVRRNFQIVMSTHSIYMAQHLPPSAIRVLEPMQSGRVRISTSYSAREALHEIGTQPHGRTLLVEDERAKHIVLSTFEKTSPQAKHEVFVSVRGGGASRIFSDIQSHADSNREDLFVLLDGDFRPAKPLPPAEELPQGLKQLKKIISNFEKGPNTAGPNLSFADSEEATRHIDFLRRHVFFLPGTTPESLVWDDDYASRIAGLAKLPNAIIGEEDFKVRIQLIADSVAGYSEETVFDMFLANFLSRDSEERQSLFDTLDTIRHSD